MRLAALRLACARPAVRSLVMMTQHLLMLTCGDYGSLKESFGVAKLKRRRVVGTRKGNYRRLKNASISQRNTALSPAMISEDFIAGIAHEALYPR